MLTHPNPRHYTPDHEAFRATVRRFVEREIIPHAAAWDEASGFPRALYGKAAAAGLLGVGFPEEVGGTPADHFYRLILAEEMGRSGSGGKARILPGVLAGEKISALAVTEPGAGSDVAQLATTAKREGDHYVVNGAKMFITSGLRADWYTVAVRTGGPGAAGVSLLAIERDTPGFTRTELKKMGWWASDTAELHFDDCRVPAKNLIGAEGQAFPLIMRNFNGERLTLAASACGAAIACLEDAVEWARSRKTFGQPLIGHQVIRHKLVDMVERIEATRALLDDLASRLDAEPSPPAPLPQAGEGSSSPSPRSRGEGRGEGQGLVAQTAMAKNTAARTMQFCADAAVQILGGSGYMRGVRVERIYREVKVMMIGGGAEEVLKDLAARQLGF
ncbi:MAG: acyl-CoA dehydrogenase [Betaproteobacteria bacterium HGW-Betaproteobacteria-14]|nr:MAG: acyl-CoA dehydrogenase [Betaproteobacteria bacterium HGW-Betaproteobacteria-14]